MNCAHPTVNVSMTLSILKYLSDDKSYLACFARQMFSHLQSCCYNLAVEVVSCFRLACRCLGYFVSIVFFVDVELLVCSIRSLSVVRINVCIRDFGPVYCTLVLLGRRSSLRLLRLNII